MDIYVVKDGYVMPYLQDAYFCAQLPILPPEVKVVKISWFSHDSMVRDIFVFKKFASEDILSLS